MFLKHKKIYNKLTNTITQKFLQQEKFYSIRLSLFSVFIKNLRHNALMTDIMTS